MPRTLLIYVLALLLCRSDGARSPSISITRPSKHSASSPSIHEDFHLLAPYYLPPDVIPGQLNYFNFTRPEGLREFYLYVPTHYNTSVSWPFAFYFHGVSHAHIPTFSAPAVRLHQADVPQCSRCLCCCLL